MEFSIGGGTPVSFEFGTNGGGFKLGIEPDAQPTSPPPRLDGGVLVAQMSAVRGLAQGSTASQPIQNATNLLLFGGAPPAGFDPAAFQYDVVPYGQQPLGRAWGRVALDPSTGRLAAYVAPDATIRRDLADRYADATHGMTADQVVDGMVANEVAGKALTIAFPGMPTPQREIVAEAATYAVAGDNWAFRHLVSIQGEHQDFMQGQSITNYALLLGVTHISMAEAGVAAGVTSNGSATEGAQMTERFFDFMSQPGVFQSYTSFPDAFRGFAEVELGLTPAEADAFATDFASRMAGNTAALAQRYVGQQTP
jgi:hypothetical protein